MASKHKIAIVQQVSDQMCWRYCGEVLFRFKGGKAKAFAGKLGKYSDVKTVLSAKAVSACYKLLDFKEDNVANLTDVLIALQPVIIGYKRNNTDGHLVMIIGQNSNGKLILNDGCFTEKKNVCKSGNQTVSIQQLNGKLTDTFWY